MILQSSRGLPLEAAVKPFPIGVYTRKDFCVHLDKLVPALYFGLSWSGRLPAGGVIGRRGSAAGQPPVKMFFSNPDKVFAGDHPTPRFGQGAFALALRALLTQVL